MRSMMRCMVLAVAGVLLAGCASLGAAPPAPQQSARLLYQIEVSAPGTRSQGWRGVLYGEDGAPIALAATRPIHARLELLVVELLDGFPVEAQRLGTNGGARHASGADPHRLGGLSMAAAEL